LSEGPETVHADGGAKVRLCPCCNFVQIVFFDADDHPFAYVALDAEEVEIAATALLKLAEEARSPLNMRCEGSA
jgi:hypothetical protein